MGDKVPELRFLGCSGEWERKTLGEIGSVVMNKRIFKHETSDVGEIPFYKIGTFGSEPDAFITRELFNEYKEKYPYPHIGDILLSASGSIGRMVEYTGKDEYFQDSNIVWLEHGNKVNNLFLRCFYTFVKWQGLEGSTIKRLYNKNILETEIFVTSLPEQTQIGTLFQTLDRLITKAQQKHQKLLAIKKAMLTKMFPQKGQTVPEVRFQGFKGEWEEECFSNITLRVSIMSSSDNLPRIEYEDIIPEKGELNKNIFRKESSKVGLQFKSGDILYGKLRPYLKNWLFPQFDGIAVGDFWVLRSEQNSNLFIYYLIQTEIYQTVANQSAGSKMPRSDWNLVAKCLIKIPKKLKEQTLIGNFFRELDHQITLQGDEIQSLKNLKQALLSKMFVS